MLRQVMPLREEIDRIKQELAAEIEPMIAVNREMNVHVIDQIEAETKEAVEKL